MQDEGSREEGPDVPDRHVGGQYDRCLRRHQNPTERALNGDLSRRSHTEQDVHVARVEVDDRTAEGKAVLDVDEYGAGRVVDVEDRLRIEAQRAEEVASTAQLQVGTRFYRDVPIAAGIHGLRLVRFDAARAPIERRE